LSAQEVRRRLGGDLAHTIINTILGRAHDKGAVERRASSSDDEYRPLLDRAGLTARRMQALLDDAAPAPVPRRFVDSLDPQAMAVLRELLDDETEHPQR
jgi:predicted transcriptional regulator